mgnify:CR=1 FL=1
MIHKYFEHFDLKHISKHARLSRWTSTFTFNLVKLYVAFILPTPNASTVGTYIVRFKQDNIGGRVVTFSNTASTTTKLYWAGGVVPIITSGANKIDFMTIICDGISYYATMIQNFY